jgi:hypothetical protein
MAVRLVAFALAAIYSQKNSWYSFLLKAEPTK